LSDEYIIPFGLGGRWILPKASCGECARKTRAFEDMCQRAMFQPLGVSNGLPTRKVHPEGLALQAEVGPHAEQPVVDCDQQPYPILLRFPFLEMPDELTGCTPGRRRNAPVRHIWIRVASFRERFILQFWIRETSHCDEIVPRLDALAAKSDAAAIAPTSTLQASDFFRILAKIGHAFAVAEMGVGSFSPFLTPMICDAVTSNYGRYVGGLQCIEPAAALIHELSFDPVGGDRLGIVAVRIRLLAALETPTYHVAVGRRSGP
jgi:hypothetical protein